MSARNDERAAACLASGFEQLQQGRTEQALRLGQQALKLAPGHPDALHLLGVVALQHAEHARALELLQQAAVLRPDEPAFHCNLGYAYIGVERDAEALSAFERAALLDPADPETHLNVGACLARLGRPAHAEAAFKRALERAPRYAPGWFNLGNALRDQERYEEACAAYERTLSLAPQHADAHHNLGVALQELGRFEEAERAYRACLGLKPHDPATMVNLAVTLNCLRRPDEAEALCRAALARDRAYGPAWPVLARALAFRYRWDEAMDCYRQAVRDFPASVDAAANLADALARVGRFTAALETFDRVKSLGEVPAYLHFASAIALFAMGRITEGAAAYFRRDQRAAFAREHPGLPLVERLPAEPSARTLGLIGEQGLGDELFFLRYAPALKRLGFRLRYCGHSALAGMLARSGWFEEVSSSVPSVRDADDRALVGDLPYLLADAAGAACALPADARRVAGEVPTQGPRAHYRVFWPELPRPLGLSALPARVAAVAARLRACGPAPYLAVTWRGGTPPHEQRGHIFSLYKEAPLEGLAGVLRGVDATLVSLQRRPLPSETVKLATAVGRPVHDFSSLNEDLEDMLALLTLVDEYVGVSNTNMHLRASVGRSARVLVPWSPEWRWMFVGDESPWFRGFRIYRQSPHGGWDAAMADLRRDLAAGAGSPSVATGEARAPE